MGSKDPRYRLVVPSSICQICFLSITNFSAYQCYLVKSLGAPFLSVSYFAVYVGAYFMNLSWNIVKNLPGKPPGVVSILR